MLSWLSPVKSQVMRAVESQWAASAGAVQCANAGRSAPRLMVWDRGSIKKISSPPAVPGDPAGLQAVGWWAKSCKPRTPHPLRGPRRLTPWRARKARACAGHAVVGGDGCKGILRVVSAAQRQDERSPVTPHDALEGLAFLGTINRAPGRGGVLCQGRGQGLGGTRVDQRASTSSMASSPSG